MELFFLTFIICILCFMNFFIFKISGQNKKKKILSGIILIMISPIIFFATFQSVIPFDSGGFGASMIAVFYTLLFILNGIMIVFIGLFTRSKRNEQ